MSPNYAVLQQPWLYDMFDAFQSFAHCHDPHLTFGQKSQKDEPCPQEAWSSTNCGSIALGSSDVQVLMKGADSGQPQDTLDMQQMLGSEAELEEALQAAKHGR